MLRKNLTNTVSYLTNAFNSARSAVGSALGESCEVAERHSGTVAMATTAGVIYGIVFSISYLSSEPEEQRGMLIAALKQIEDTYNCTTTKFRDDFRGVEYQCGDVFTKDQAEHAAIEAVNNIKGSVGFEVLRGMAVALTSPMLFGTLAFFGSTAVLKAKEEAEELYKARKEAAAQAQAVYEMEAQELGEELDRTDPFKKLS